MTEIVPELPDDDREKYEWQSKYKQSVKDSRNPICEMRKEAIYLLILLLVAFLVILANYKGWITNLLGVPTEDVFKVQRIIWCLCAGLIGGTTFSIKIFYRAVARGQWNLDRRYWRLFSPVISVSVTSVVAAFMIDKVLDSHIYWTYTIGYFAGYFSEHAVGKMYDIAVVLFSTPVKTDNDNSKDKRKQDE